MQPVCIARSLCVNQRHLAHAHCSHRGTGILLRRADPTSMCWILNCKRQMSNQTGQSEIVARGRAAVSSSYAVRSTDEQMEHYKQWASTYDHDQKARGWLGPSLCAEVLAEQLEPSRWGVQPVLDAGAGTGLMGPYLKKLGFQSLIAFDLSNDMLAVAEQTGAYSKVAQGVLGERLPFATDYFGAVVSSGTFTEGHAPASSFDELVRVTRPEGRIIFTLKCDIKDSAGFTRKFHELTADGKWTLVNAGEPRHLHLTSTPECPLLQIFSFRVL